MQAKTRKRVSGLIRGWQLQVQSRRCGGNRGRTGIMQSLISLTFEWAYYRGAYFLCSKSGKAWGGGSRLFEWSLFSTQTAEWRQETETRNQDYLPAIESLVSLSYCVRDSKHTLPTHSHKAIDSSAGLEPQFIFTLFKKPVNAKYCVRRKIIPNQSITPPC